MTVEEVMKAATNWLADPDGGMAYRAVQAIRNAKLPEDEMWALITETMDALMDHAASGVEADMRWHA